MKWYQKYFVDKLGYVFNKATGKELKGTTTTAGYKQVCLTLNKKEKSMLVHRLVAETFLPNPQNFSEVNHKDGDKANNYASNLEWCSRQQNAQHSYNIGLQVHKKGEDWYSSKLSEKQVRYIRKMYSFRKYTFVKLAEELKVSKGTVADAYHGRTWNHI